MTLKEMNDLQKKEAGEAEVYNQVSKVVGKEYLFRIRIDDYNLKNPERALTVSSISAVTAPPAKRMRTLTPSVRQLGFSSPTESGETHTSSAAQHTAIIASQDTIVPEDCPQISQTPNADGGASTSAQP